MSEELEGRELWRCAVLRSWSSEYGQALLPIATVAWVEGDTMEYVRTRWVPAATRDELAGAAIWRDRIADTDPSVLVVDFLNHYKGSETTAVVECAVPEEAESPSGAADVLLDEVVSIFIEEPYDTDMLIGDLEEQVQ